VYVKNHTIDTNTTYKQNDKFLGAFANLL